MTGERDSDSFQAHVELLESFLARRTDIVERIQELLNVQRKPADQRQDVSRLSRQFEDCFFVAATETSRRLRGQLQRIHWASGFRPRAMSGVHNDLVEPAQLMIRGFHLWQQTRWPGRSGRVHYAHTLFNAYLIRCLELLSMRLWDDGPGQPSDRLQQIKGLLHGLWSTSPPTQPIFVRDARWLLPLAQSPTTDELWPYFAVLDRVEGSLNETDRTEIHKAAVVMAGGHLRSQLRHLTMKDGAALDEVRLTVTSRNSNALDFAVLIRGLAWLLECYERALRASDGNARIELAGAICQGISSDPELFVNRLDLLGVYSMIEPLFISPDPAAGAVYTPVGRRHVRSLNEYAERMSRASKALHEDLARFDPMKVAYSPFGLVYGFSSNLSEHMALKSLQVDTITGFSIEDAFSDGGADKLAWVSGWRKLPHVDPDMQRLFEYPQTFAHDIYERLERALRRRLHSGAADAAERTGRLCIVTADDREGLAPAWTQIAELPIRYIGSSDAGRVAANLAHPYDQAQLLRDRQEGTFLVSYETDAGWVAISKDFFTEIVGEGSNVKLAGLAPPVIAALRLMCPNLVLVTGGADRGTIETMPENIR